ncbi:MAG: chromate transporter [Acidobacteriaceae bacterium]
MADARLTRRRSPPFGRAEARRAEFVARRAWLDERAFADLVAFCQLLPGPASSQVGIALAPSWPGSAQSLGRRIAIRDVVGQQALKLVTDYCCRHVLPLFLAAL